MTQTELVPHDPERVETAITFGREIAQNGHHAYTGDIREALADIDRLRPTGAMANFGGGDVAKNNARQLHRAITKLGAAIGNYPTK